MSETKEQFKDKYENASRFTRSVFDNFTGSELPTELRRDLKESYEFYLDDEDRLNLAGMGKVKRSLFSVWYLTKNLFMKLTPVRRIIVFIGLVVAFGGMPDETDEVLFGFLLLLFVLGLELKDKLTAHDELEAGRAVQLAIMPESIPELDGWELWMHSTPANEVGGDLIDHLTLSDSELALTLGDVAGKGLPAALMAAKIQATLRAIAPDYSDLTARADRLNSILIRDGLPNKFASLIHLCVESKSSTVSLVNAGHHPPILISVDGAKEIGKGGPAVGLTRKATYSTEQVSMAPNDLLLLYTDGVTEARNEIGRFYSDERLMDLIVHTHGMTAASMGHRILRSVEDFVHKARQSDDISLIVLRRLT
jgi:sigma-B regulation protein RsbU (phosphoserine phosphatase)